MTADSLRNHADDQKPVMIMYEGILFHINEKRIQTQDKTCNCNTYVHVSTLTDFCAPSQLYERGLAT